MDFRRLAIIKTGLLAVALLACCGATGSTQIIDFSIDGGNSFGNAFAVGIGSSTTVEVYLSEISPDTTLSTDGLFSLGLEADLDATAPGLISSASVDPQFDFLTTDNFNALAIEWEAAVFANSVPTASAVRLGGFQFVSTGAGVSNFTFRDNQPGTGTLNAKWATGTGGELDELIFGSGASDTFSLLLTTNSVPEPGTISLVVLGAMILTGYRRRKARAVAF